MTFTVNLLLPAMSFRVTDLSFFKKEDWISFGIWKCMNCSVEIQVFLLWQLYSQCISIHEKCLPYILKQCRPQSYILDEEADSFICNKARLSYLAYFGWKFGFYMLVEYYSVIMHFELMFTNYHSYFITVWLLNISIFVARDVYSMELLLYYTSKLVAFLIVP